MTDVEWIALFDRATLGAVWVGAVTYTLFVVGYMVVARQVWWRVWPGRALVSSSLGTALLLDLTLTFRVFEPSPLVGAAITVAVVCLIALGGLLKCFALVHGALTTSTPPDPT